MAKATIRTDLDEALDVERHLAAQVALDLVAPIDQLAQAVDLLFGEVADEASRKVVDEIAAVPVGRNDKPVNPVVIESVEITES